MDLSPDTLQKLRSILKDDQLESVLQALSEDPPEEWKIEAKLTLDGSWFHIGSVTSKERSLAIVEEFATKDPSGFYRVLDPKKSVIKTHPDDLWIHERENLKQLKIVSPPDWNDYNSFLLQGGDLDYEDWQLIKDQPSKLSTDGSTEAST